MHSELLEKLFIAQSYNINCSEVIFSILHIILFSFPSFEIWCLFLFYK